MVLGIKKATQSKETVWRKGEKKTLPKNPLPNEPNGFYIINIS